MSAPTSQALGMPIMTMVLTLSVIMATTITRRSLRMTVHVVPVVLRMMVIPIIIRTQ